MAQRGDIYKQNRLKLSDMLMPLTVLKDKPHVGMTNARKQQGSKNISFPGSKPNTLISFYTFPASYHLIFHPILSLYHFSLSSFPHPFPFLSFLPSFLPLLFPFIPFLFPFFLPWKLEHFSYIPGSAATTLLFLRETNLPTAVVNYELLSTY